MAVTGTAMTVAVIVAETYPRFSNRPYNALALLMRGVFRRRSERRSRVRFPRVRLVTSHSGGSGTPPAAHYEAAARSSLDGAGELLRGVAARLTREGRR